MTKILVGGSDKGDIIMNAVMNITDKQCRYLYRDEDGVKLSSDIKEFNPDIVIMYPFLNDRDALTIVKEAVENKSKAKFIILITPAMRRIVRFFNTSYPVWFLQWDGTEYQLKKTILDVIESSEKSGVSLAKANAKELNMIVSDILHNIGIPAHLKGYKFMRSGILLVLDDPSYMESVTKKLYPDIAKENNSSAVRVERAIRHAIEIAWERGNLSIIDDIFGYTVDSDKGKPTNSQFIASIVDKIQIDQKKKEVVANG